MNTYNTSVMLYAHRTVHAVFQTLGMTEFLAFALDLTIAFRGNNYALNSHRIGPPIAQPCTAQPTNQPISLDFYKQNNTNSCSHLSSYNNTCAHAWQTFKRPLDTKLTGAMPKELSYNAFSHIAAGFLVMMGAITMTAFCLLALTLISMGSSSPSP
ncbi:hypothetical protein GQX74_014957 [Glossina fuscipes]|nr:hypothetical protein GQX74_014957 [Glossina fuscipes]